MTYKVQTAHGAQVDTGAERWWDVAFPSDLDQAREAMADVFAGKLDREDRGEEFESEWACLINRSKTAEVGEILYFSEFAARIVEDAD